MNRWKNNFSYFMYVTLMVSGRLTYKQLNDELRRQRREKYLVSKAEYAAAIRQEKSRSWKEYCNATSEVNPWNAICKMTAGKTKRVAHITTLRQLDGSLTTDLQGTLSLMIQKFAPEDNQEDDTDNHRQTRNLKSMTMDMDDAEFTEQVTNVLHDTGNKRAPGKEGIPNEVWKGLVKILRKYITAIYNKCLKEGVFPKRWKTAKIIPNVKPGKEVSDEASKSRPISLLASGGKVFEKLLINRINHHVYTRGHMNENQFGFRPQKSTVDAALAIKDFVQKSLEAGDMVALVSLDVQGAFYAAWWPGILRELRKAIAPRTSTS